MYHDDDEGDKMKSTTLKMLINLYPPYWGTGIRLSYISEDYREATVTMKLRFYNRNYVNTHFGGSLYTMADPFYMLMLIHILGREYVVWDKAASIEFISPARGTVFAHFTITDQIIEQIEKRTAAGEKYLPQFEINITDTNGKVVARVNKTIYIRRKGNPSR
jgi:acyl-coenzyme A thioesterase PaaI-like protein